MFYELIYTRCKNGIDVLRNGSLMTNEGYKVYACSPEIYSQENLVDKNLLVNAAQYPQSYRDSQEDPFMDEAYVYYVPDYGENFLINFHPVPFDPTREGNYTKKPGNFLNQVLIGNFSSFYIWQFFDDSSIWNAKRHDEPYYYAVNPTPLKMREIEPSGKYSYDTIRTFISNGRKELLKKAVAFLILQYSLDPSDRRYLIIQDENTENIELWIAAIECAFSPRISASIPFATRLDKYSNVNHYTVKNGKFQTMTNYQDQEQSLRYRAMIVGVNAVDKSNNDPIRVLAVSQFELLDGINLKISYEPKIDIQLEYFDLITKFDDEHKAFCTVFLQSININVPATNLPNIYKAFKALKNVPTVSMNELIEHISVLNACEFVNVKAIYEIYYNVKNNIDVILSKNFALALNVTQWINDIALQIGDNTANDFLNLHICNFANRVAKKFPDADYAVQFYCIYIKALGILGRNHLHNNVLPVLSECLKKCAEARSIAGIKKLLSICNIESILDAGKECAEFTVKSIIEADNSIVSSIEKTIQFCNILNARGMNSAVVYALHTSIRTIEDMDEIAKFAQWISNSEYINSNDKARLFVALDNKVIYGANLILPRAIDKYSPKDAKCSRTANILGICIMKKAVKENIGMFIKHIQRLETQGFPCMLDDKNFIEDFSRYFVAIKYEKEDTAQRNYMLNLLFKKETPIEFLLSVVHELISNVEKYKVQWNYFLAYSSKHVDIKKLSFNAIVDEILESRNIKKQLKRLNSSTSSNDDNALLFFSEIENEVKSQIKPGLLEKVFGIFKHNNE